MRDFTQATEYDAHKHVRIQDLMIHRFFVNNCFKFRFLGIFYGGIMHKYKFAQVHCVDLLKSIYTKFSM
jgi:hypothetical protein